MRLSIALGERCSDGKQAASERQKSCQAPTHFWPLPLASQTCHSAVRLTLPERTTFRRVSKAPAAEESPVVSPSWSEHVERYGRSFGATRAVWRTLTFYQRFEQIISLVLTVLISLVIVGAVLNLTFRIAILLLFGLIDPAEQELFHAIFGMVLTVLIALELNHSILGVLERKNSIIQVRTVVLVSLLALVRKFIVLDTGKTESLTIIGLALAVVALGSVYWLVRDQDRKEAATVEKPPGLVQDGNHS
ncbi:MAG: phosphate-starvation-inducible PsiE family protein [Beijerinckiaceae bacterium]|nr:phosphate-starvation-inducible PsiE family protein [Beijerinckiaceae bacterium]